MKPRHVPSLTILCFAVLCSGCQLFKVSPGSDPVVVNAERTHQSAFEAVKLFLAVDADNRQYMKDQLPDIHKWAETLRESDESGKSQFERTFSASWSAIKTYKVTRTPESGQVMNDTIAKVSDLARTARSYLTKMPPR